MQPLSCGYLNPAPDMRYYADVAYRKPAQPVIARGLKNLRKVKRCGHIGCIEISNNKAARA